MKESDTSREDIRAAVDAKLEEWGVERPERGLDALLTEDQETELKTLIEGLRASDTSREDIRVAVDAKLEEWGIERPERSRGGNARTWWTAGQGRRGPKRTSSRVHEIQDNLSVLWGRVFALPHYDKPIAIKGNAL